MFIQKKSEQSLNPSFHLKNGLIGESVHLPCVFFSTHLFYFLNPSEASTVLVKLLKFPPKDSAQTNKKKKGKRLKALQSVKATAHFSHSNGIPV